jgi:hypothetical protein
MLLSDVALELGRHPDNLRALVEQCSRGDGVCIDEVQKASADHR